MACNNSVLMSACDLMEPKGKTLAKYVRPILWMIDPPVLMPGL
ncbi:hypothetical protein CHCC20375_2483 [Bacillus licheniformis]|nr:hypothetical protein CHCC20375_2483 [Bacillus licheniformis]